jgi:DEAD/DEAH box helicase
MAMIEAAMAGRHALLIAPTGGGKTLAGFLPSLVELAETDADGLHTLYVSPLKALTVDVHRNLEQPIAGRCFVSDGMRLIVPSFGAYTGGLDVFNPALAGLLAPGFAVHLLGRARVHAFSAARLIGAPGQVATSVGATRR